MSCEEAFDNIPKNWLILEVGDLVKRGILEKPMDGNHGSIHPKAKDYVNQGIPFIMAADLKNGYIDFDRCKFITHQQAKTLKKGFAKKGDVLLTHKGTIGRVALVKDLSTQYLVLTPQVTYYRVRNNKLLLNKYLLYYFMSEKFQHFFLAFAGSGSTRNYLGITHQLKLPVVLPPIEEQHRIANILSTIDDKIELNHQINQDLEEMAQAIFKSWFIDFEPFRDGEFVDSELGPIPKGWRVSKLGEVCTVTGGGTPKTKVNEYWENGDILWATPSDMTAQSSLVIFDTSKKITELGLQKSSAKLLPKGTVLMTSRATIGYTSIAMAEISTNQGFINIICDKEVSNYFMLFFIRSFKDKIKRIANGSTFMEVSKKNFKELDIVVPPSNWIEKFDQHIEPIIENVYKIEQQNQILSNLRDTLLPKLMSGEIRV